MTKEDLKSFYKSKPKIHKFYWLSRSNSMELFEKLWELLGQKLSQLFGRECASAAILMFISLCIRWVTYLLGLEDKLSLGLIFAFPLIVQLLTANLPFMDSSNPLLPVRIAESLLGQFRWICIFFYRSRSYLNFLHTSHRDTYQSQAEYQHRN